MIKCAHCKERHETVVEVKKCSLVFNQVKQPSVDQAALANIAQIFTTSSEKPQVHVTEPGMYRVGEDVFQVVWNKSQTRLYANKLVPTYVAGKLHRLDFHYDRGAIFGIKPSDRMTLDEVAQLGKISGRCWVCRRTLKTAKSIAAGIGPVCVKNV